MGRKRGSKPYDSKQLRFRKTNEVPFSFEKPEEIDKFYEAVSSGGNCRDDKFWEFYLTVKIGDSTWVRPGKNSFNEKTCYFVKRLNEKAGSYSYVELEKSYFKEFSGWLIERFAEVDKLREESIPIQFLSKHPELASPEKNGLLWPVNMFDEKVTLSLGNFRIRPVFNKSCGMTLFVINSKASSPKFPGWHGPTIWLKVSELREILAHMYEFEQKF